MKISLICHENNANNWLELCQKNAFNINILVNQNVIDCEIKSVGNKKTMVLFDTHLFTEMTVLSTLKKYNSHYLVVIDASINYAPLIIRNNHEFQVNDYLQGTIGINQIEEAIIRFKKSVEADPTDMVVGEYFVVKDRGESTFINLNNITVLEGLGAYTKVHSINKQYIVSKNLKKLLEQLPKCFIRTHRSFAVHIKHINSLSGNQVLLHNGESVKASKSGKKILISRFSMA